MYILKSFLIQSRPQEIRDHNAKGIVFSGGPASVYETGAFHSDPSLLENGNSCAWHLLRNAIDHLSARRQSGWR